MSKVTNFNQAIYTTIQLLEQPKYRNHKEVIKICEKLMNQAYIFELFGLGEDTYTIAAGTGQSEKTVRFHRDGDQASLKSITLYKDYLKKVKRQKDAKV